jgi:hypothetical protein
MAGVRRTVEKEAPRRSPWIFRWGIGLVPAAALVAIVVLWGQRRGGLAPPSVTSETEEMASETFEAPAEKKKVGLSGAGTKRSAERAVESLRSEETAGPPPAALEQRPAAGVPSASTAAPKPSVARRTAGKPPGSPRVAVDDLLDQLLSGAGDDRVHGKTVAIAEVRASEKDLEPLAAVVRARLTEDLVARGIYGPAERDDRDAREQQAVATADTKAKAASLPPADVLLLADIKREGDSTVLRLRLVDTASNRVLAETRGPMPGR